MLPHLLAAITVPRLGPGRARTRPDRVVADKAYSSRASRQPLRARKIVAVIAERSDQQANRKRRGSKGGRPVSSFNALKNWRGLATRYDKLAVLTAAVPSSPRSSPGYGDKETRPRASTGG
jgi:hypothetical protein